MPKSPDAFRTISEVADWLGVQAHVLRFWESKFSQVKPIKRAGGRRYYRPTDMLLLGGIKQLLHEDGLTIKGARKLIREKGTAYVADMSQPLDDLTAAVIEGTAEDVTDSEEAQSTELIATYSDPAPMAETPLSAQEDAAPSESNHAQVSDTPDSSQEPETSEVSDADTPAPVEDAPPSYDETTPQEMSQPAEDQEAEAIAEERQDDDAAPDEDDPDSEEADTQNDEDETRDIPVMPSFRAAHARNPVAPDEGAISEGDKVEVKAEPDEPATPEATADNEEEQVSKEKFQVTPPQPEDTPERKPRIIDVGPLPELADFPGAPSVLSALSGVKSLSADETDEIKPLLARLIRLRASMSSQRNEIGKD